MEVDIIKEPARHYGATRVYKVGLERLSGGSDFTASGLTQTILLETTEDGDFVGPIVVELKTPCGHASTVTVSVGANGTFDDLLAATDCKGNVGALAKADATVRANVSGGQEFLSAKFTVGAGNVSAMTAGDLWIYVPLYRKADRDLIEG